MSERLMGNPVMMEHLGGPAVAAASLVIPMARTERRFRHLHAFPSPDNAASNAVCKRLGFTNLGVRKIEFAPGAPALCHDWRLELW